MIYLSIIFGVAVVLLTFSFFVYPLCLVIIRAVFFKKRKDSKFDSLPKVMFVFPCCWEGQRIRAKIENTLLLDYPRDKMDVVAISDAASPETISILEEAEKKGGMRIIRNSIRSGKSAALAKALDQCDAEVFVVTDADALLEPSHLKKLVMPFSDSRVGAVTGTIRYENEAQSGISNNEGLYWKFEMVTRKAESLIGMLTGVVGAVYAIRPELFKITDPRLDADFLAPLLALEKKKIVLFLDHIVAKDYSPSSSEALFARRLRTISLGLLSLFKNSRFLNPFRFPMLSWELWSHKILRWLLPVFMLLIFVSNAFMINISVFWFILFCVQVLFYLMGIIGCIIAKFNKKAGILSSIWYFILSSYASMVAFVNVFTGRDFSVWGDTARR